MHLSMIMCVCFLQFFRSVQNTCTELLKVIEKYQQRITREWGTWSSTLFVCTDTKSLVQLVFKAIACSGVHFLSIHVCRYCWVKRQL